MSDQNPCDLGLPNKLTISRIFLIPIFVAFLLSNMQYGDWLAAAIFSVAALMDGIDGYLARVQKRITILGKFLDPLADKLLISAALIALVELGRLSSWVAILIIGREFAVTALRLTAVAKGEVISASSLGKAKTVSQIIAIIGLILTLPNALNALLIGTMVLITIISGFDYYAKAKGYLGDPINAE